MLGDVGALIPATFKDPRGTFRRILDAAPTRGTLLRVAAGGALVSLALTLAPFLFSQDALVAMLAAEMITQITENPEMRAQFEQAGQTPIEMVRAVLPAAVLIGGVAALGLMLLLYSVFAWLFWRIGAAFGGTGDLPACRAASAWSMVMGAVLTAPVAGLNLAGAQSLASGAQLVTMIYAIYLQAAFVAEAHGFASVARVAAAMLGLGFTAMFVLSLLFI